MKTPARGLDALRGLFFDRHGALSRELDRAPGGLGLGQVPLRLAPDATTTAVCGYCSTGCGLEVHLRGGKAVNLSPALDHPVNRGAACPKGWEALAALDAGDRAVGPGPPRGPGPRPAGSSSLSAGRRRSRRSRRVSRRSRRATARTR
jgi:hypothetical protein